MKWHNVIHKRIPNYFKLYTVIVNFSMYMCVAHANMISIYDMTKPSGSGWINTIQCSDNIRYMFIKKRSK